MLQTYKHACNVSRKPMINPARIHKVGESMRRIKVVLGERYRAYKQATDPQWVALRAVQTARKQARRVVLRTYRQRKPATPGMYNPSIPHFRQTRAQRLSLFKRPRFDAPAPEPRLPTVEEIKKANAQTGTLTPESKKATPFGKRVSAGEYF